MKYLAFALCLVCLWGLSYGAGSFKYTSCSKNNETVIGFINKLELDPDPVVMKRGNITAFVDFDILADVPEDAMLKVKFYKLKSVFGLHIDIPIPCVLGKFGSCNLPVCKYLEIYKEQGEPFFPKDIPYGCPLKAGKYGGDNTVKIPDLGIFGRLLVSGKYRIELEAIHQKKSIACYKVLAEIR